MNSKAWKSCLHILPAVIPFCCFLFVIVSPVISAADVSPAASTESISTAGAAETRGAAGAGTASENGTLPAAGRTETTTGDDQQPADAEVVSGSTSTGVVSSNTGTAQPEEPKPDTIVDTFHAGISKTIQGMATWVDSFFGNRRYESELNESYGRFSYYVFLERGARAVKKTDVHLRWVLPQLREKTHLVLSGTPKETAPFSAINTSEQVSTGEERNVTASLSRTFLDTVQQNFMVRTGLKFHKLRPMATLGPRYRLTFPLASWTFRFVEETTWRNNAGWDSRATIDLERPLSQSLFFRASTDWLWTEHNSGFYYSVSFSIAQALKQSRALSYEWANIFHTRPINELLELDLRVRYRQTLWRDWIFLEICPQYRFSRGDHFKAIPGMLIRIEAVFGHYR